MMKSALILVLAYFVLVTPTSAEAPALPLTPPQSVWTQDANGTSLHLQSQLECPRNVGSYRVDRVISFDQFGFDVGCNYTAGLFDAVTIYITKRGGRDIAGDLQKAISELQMTHTDAVPVDGDDDPGLPGATSWLHAVFIEQKESLHTAIWMTDYSGWTLEFRITYPGEHRQRAFDAIKALTASAQNAQMHLAACAQAPLPERNGRQITDTKLTYGMGAVGIAALIAKTDKPDPAPEWCAERTFTNTAVPLLLWRNIGMRGASTPVERFTLPTTGPSPAFDVVASVFASVGLNKDRDPSAGMLLAHILFADARTRPAAFAFFDGEPDPNAAAPLVADILNKKSQPLMYLNQSGTVVINGPAK